MYVKFAPVPVDDVDRAIDFYTKKIGLTLASDVSRGEDGRWVELAMPGGETRLLLQRAAADRDKSVPCLVIVADFIEADYKRMADAGVSFLHEPRPAPWMPDQIFALLHDSEGNLLMLASE